LLKDLECYIIELCSLEQTLPSFGLPKMAVVENGLFLAALAALAVGSPPPPVFPDRWQAVENILVIEGK
jgi:hypothetical protein